MSITEFLAKVVASKPKRSVGKENPEIDIHTEGEVVCSFCKKEVKVEGWKCVECNAPLSLVDRCYFAYQDAKDAKAVFDAYEQQLLKIFSLEYEEAALAGEFSKTFNFVGRLTPGVQFSAKDQFKSIPLEKEEALKKICRGDYEKFFQQERKLSLRDTSDEAIEELLSSLGEEKFKTLFNVSVSLTTKPDMDARQFSIPEKAKLQLDQYKPSMKIRSDK